MATLPQILLCFLDFFTSYQNMADRLCSRCGLTFITNNGVDPVITGCQRRGDHNLTIIPPQQGMSLKE